MCTEDSDVPALSSKSEAEIRLLSIFGSVTIWHINTSQTLDGSRCVCCGSLIHQEYKYWHSCTTLALRWFFFCCCFFFALYLCICLRLSQPLRGMLRGGARSQLLSEAFEVTAGRGCREADISFPSSCHPSRTTTSLPPTTSNPLPAAPCVLLISASFLSFFFFLLDRGIETNFFQGTRLVKKSWQLPSAPTTHWAEYELKEPLYGALYSSTPLSFYPLWEVGEVDETFFGSITKCLNSRTSTRVPAAMFFAFTWFINNQR